MIEPALWPRFARAFAWLADRKLQGRFATAYVSGLERLLNSAHEGPTIVVANHSSWWDGMVALWLHHHLGDSGAYALMDAANLREHAFFARMGAVGVDVDDPRDGARVLRWARRELKGTRDTLWVFPQGRETPGNPRPFHFEAGAAALARLIPGARVLPLALDYLFVGNEAPSLFISVGDELDARAPAHDQAAAVETELDRIAWLVEGGRLDASQAGEAGFELIFGASGRTKTDLGTRLLSALVGPRNSQTPQRPKAIPAGASVQANPRV